MGSFYEHLEEILLVSLVVLMVSMGFLQILFRKLISVGIVWIDSLVRHLVLWIALLGASIATRENRHISIDVLSGRVSPVHYFKVQGAVQLFSALVCLLLVYPAVRFIHHGNMEFQRGQVADPDQRIEIVHEARRYCISAGLGYVCGCDP